jgi:hypothetical protein
VLQAGGGVGVIAGYGVPTFRVFVGVRWSPTSHDADHDGISDSKDKCPNVAEDMDGIDDMDGCPEEDPDGDQDGVPDHEDDCPEAKETINGIDDDDGCPDTGDPRVIYEDGEFKRVVPTKALTWVPKRGAAKVRTSPVAAGVESWLSSDAPGRFSSPCKALYARSRV